MFKINFITISVASLLIMSNANASGLAQDVDELQITAETLVSAVAENAEDIEKNKKSIRSNESDIEENDEGIEDNKSSIRSNESAIEENASAVEAVQSQVSAIPTPVIYDYRDYEGNVSSKTFSLRFPQDSCGDREVRTFTRIVNGDVTRLNVNRIRTVAGSACQNRSFNFVLTAKTRKLVSKENNSLGGNLRSTDILNKPFTLRTSAMVEGKSFGGATGIKRLPVGGTAALVGVFVHTTIVERQQRVTVPAGTFEGCIKVHTVRASSVIGRFNRYSWLCPGIGEVKRTQIDPVTLKPRFWKLISYTP